MAPNVYIIQADSAKNYSTASEYGIVKFLLPFGGMCRESSAHMMAKTLSEFREDDYIVPVGDPYLIGLAMALIVANGIRNIKVLSWNKYDKKYSVVTACPRKLMEDVVDKEVTK